MSYKMNNIFLIVYAVLCFGVLKCEMLNVNPKVEFIDEESSTARNQQEKVAPKIQSVSVSVDTSNLNKRIDGKEAPDSRTEIIKIQTKGDGKQTVGIRTDITLEISDSKNDSNSTKSNGGGRLAENDSTEDVDVPIFRGTDNSKNRNNFHRRYDPNTVGHNRPIFQRTNDDVVNFDRSGGTWINFVPVTWTTERNYEQNSIQKNRGFHNSYVPYAIGEKAYKPCFCSNEDSSWTSISIPVHRRSFRPTTVRPNKVDDKLEDPFSEAG